MHPSPLSYLQDDYLRLYPTRVRLARYGAVRFGRASSKALGRGHAGSRPDQADQPVLVVVDESRRRVQVVAEDHRLRLLLWVDRDDLGRVVTGSVVLAGDPSGGAGAHPAVRLDPGLPVEVVARQHGMAKIQHGDGCVRFAGWVPESLLGSEYEPALEPDVEGDWTVATGTPVYDRPGGWAVASFTGDCQVATDGADVEGMRPIHYTGRSFELRGFVAATASPPGSRLMAQLSGFGLYGLMGGFSLPEGTCLYARPGGEVVGRVLEDTWIDGARERDGGFLVLLPSSWGPLPAWVATENPPASGGLSGHDPRPRAGGGAVIDASGLRAVHGHAHPPLRTCR